MVKEGSLNRERARGGGGKHVSACGGGGGHHLFFANMSLPQAYLLHLLLDVVRRRFGSGVVVIVVDPRRGTLGIAAPRALSAAARRLIARLLAAVVLAGVHVLENVLITHPTQRCRKGVESRTYSGPRQVAAVAAIAERRITLHYGARGTVLLRCP